MITYSQLNEKLMVSVIDKLQKQEQVFDQQLMQLALVDIASGLNANYEIRNDN